MSAGDVRVNGEHCSKPATVVKVGDVLTINAGSRVRVVKVLAFGVRRGPAAEAATLYEDLTPALPQRDEDAGPASPSPERRPTSRERRAISQFKNKHFDA